MLSVEGVQDIAEADGSFDQDSRTLRYSARVVDENGDEAAVSV